MTARLFVDGEPDYDMKAYVDDYVHNQWRHRCLSADTVDLIRMAYQAGWDTALIVDRIKS